MSNRIISMLLCVCMVAAFFVGVAPQAFAQELPQLEEQEANTAELPKVGEEQEVTSTVAPVDTPKPSATPAPAAKYNTYKVASGDTFYRYCTRLGIAFNADAKKAIMYLNGFSSESQMSVLKVGQEVKVPASTAAVKEYAALYSPAGGGNSGTTGGNGTSSGGASGSLLLPGDAVSFYLINYTLQAGDTLYSVCNALGTSFNTYEKLINELNGLKSYTRLAAGSVLIIPSKTAPTSGACYMVVAHKMVSGDTAYGLCQSYGLNYNSNQAVLKALNNKTDLTRFAVGATFLIPIHTVVTQGNPSGNNTNPSVPTSVVVTATPPPSNKPVETTKPEDAEVNGYRLYSNPTNGGSYSVTVGGLALDTAKKGEIVTVNAVPAAGYSLKRITGAKADDASVAAVFDKNVSFYMQNYDVTITVEFEGSLGITCASAAGGKVSYTVDGVSTTNVSSGQKITVKLSPSSGYAAIGFKAYRSTDPNDVIPVLADDESSFTMPDFNVTIEPEFGKQHNITINTANGGSAYTAIKGHSSSVKAACAGQEIQICGNPKAGYVLDISNTQVIFADTNASVAVTSDGTFIMPDTSVVVKPVFVAVSTAHKVSVASVKNGSVKTTYLGAPVVNVPEGDTIVIVPTANSGYSLSKVTATFVANDKKSYTYEITDIGHCTDSSIGYIEWYDKDGNSLTGACASAAEGQLVFNFLYDVTLTYTFSAVQQHSITVNYDSAECASAAAINKNSAISGASFGTKVSVQVSPVKGYYVDSISVNGTSLTPENGVYSFDMPDEDVVIAVTMAAASTHSVSLGTVTNGSLEILADNQPISGSVLAGTTISLNAKPDSGCNLTQLTVKNSAGRVYFENVYTFTMPDDDLIIDAAFEQGAFNINNYVDSSYATITTKVERNGLDMLSTTAKVGETVKIECANKPGYELDNALVVTNAKSGKKIPVSSNSFVMPAADVNITADIKAKEVTITATVTPTNSTIELTVGGKNARLTGSGGTYTTTGYSGDTVVITPKAADGYTIESIVVKPDTGSDYDIYTVSGSSFVLPAVDVELEVNFQTDTYAIYDGSDVHTALRCAVDNDGSFKNGNEARFGSDVKVEVTIDVGYELKDWNVTNYDTGRKLKSGVSISGPTTDPQTKKSIYNIKFTMPDGDAVVNVTTRPKYITLKSDNEMLKFRTSLLSGKKDTVNVEVGSSVTLVTNFTDSKNIKELLIVADDGVSFEPYAILPSSKTMTVPTADAAVKVIEGDVEYRLSTKTGSSVGSGKVSAFVDGKSTAVAAVGKEVTVNVTPVAGYKLKAGTGIQIVPANEDTPAVTITSPLAVDKDGVGVISFTMPADNVIVICSYEKK